MQNENPLEVLGVMKVQEVENKSVPIWLDELYDSDDLINIDGAFIPKMKKMIAQDDILKEAPMVDIRITTHYSYLYEAFETIKEYLASEFIESDSIELNVSSSRSPVETSISFMGYKK